MFTIKRCATVIFISVCSFSSHAAAPGSGVAIEGFSVPGAILGDTRADIEASFGDPLWCQSITSGDAAYCNFPIQGGGSVSVVYTSPTGAAASNSPSDIATSFQWEGNSNWVTSAGVNTELVGESPQILTEIYPHATAIYHSLNGELFQLRDAGLGIQVDRFFNFYTGMVLPHIKIFAPQGLTSTPAPTPDPTPVPTPTPTPEPAPSPSIEVECTHTVVASSRNSFEAVISITNIGSSSISDWSVSWEFSSARLRSAWDAVIDGRTSITAKPVGSNSVIAAGETIEFGYTAKGSAETPPFTDELCGA